MNLLLNARDAVEDRKPDGHHPEAKRITLRVAVDAADPAFVAAEIADTGDGIPPEVQDKIFEPFFTTKATGKGTGLGLSISYGIVKEYGGAIEAISTPGQGARFVVRLPLARAGQGGG
jgi:histidine kinase